jgi:hypothetical protein
MGCEKVIWNVEIRAVSRSGEVEERSGGVEERRMARAMST